MADGGADNRAGPCAQHSTSERAFLTSAKRLATASGQDYYQNKGTGGNPD
jgi:hypothetical protein